MTLGEATAEIIKDIDKKIERLEQEKEKFIQLLVMDVMLGTSDVDLDSFQFSENLIELLNDIKERNTNDGTEN